ncbi:TPA: hypothetical protein ACM6YW_005216 [Escherichia coli]|uniref:hypothetical protein n=1 Tax=Escherichia coli TaxID=562 RepID=UPI00048AA5EC|nr:hypothetical protein [Escherichia coli]EFG4448229.1 hypothetical protein [Escherichia coli]EGE1560382.1 hypothetical protein [Escherichia coli]OWC18089.1 hypothetical protein A8G17_10525 [Escherichia coli]QKB21856.1 hypothetical protein E3158_07100 [Escherichia coli O55:H7]RCP43602.1 hypothetical protein A6581_01980 [Escherichia coli]
MSRRYVKELAIESGTPLGIVPSSNYAKALNRDSVVKVISKDMNMVGNDLRRSESRVYAEYIVKNGKKIAAPVGGKWAIVTGKNSNARGKSEAKGMSFDKYAKIYWATK